MTWVRQGLNLTLVSPLSRLHHVKSRDGTNLRLECPDASEVTSLPPAEEMRSRLGQRVAEAVTTRQGPASLKRAQGYHMGHGKTDC